MEAKQIDDENFDISLVLNLKEELDEQLREDPLIEQPTIPSWDQDDDGRNVENPGTEQPNIHNFNDVVVVVERMNIVKDEWTRTPEIAIDASKISKRDKILIEKRRASKLRYDKMKADPKLRKLITKKNREHYLKRKKNKTIVSIKELKASEQEMQREKWRKNTRAYRMKKKKPSCSTESHKLKEKEEWLKELKTSEQETQREKRRKNIRAYRKKKEKPSCSTESHKVKEKEVRIKELMTSEQETQREKLRKKTKAYRKKKEKPSCSTESHKMKEKEVRPSCVCVYQIDDDCVMTN